MVRPARHSDSPSRAGSLSLIAGDLALDFTNTSSGRGSAQNLDHLRQPAHVVVWAEHAGILNRSTAERLLVQVETRDPSVATLLLDALELRETIYRVFAALADRRDPLSKDLSTLNHRYADAIAHANLDVSGGWSLWRWPTNPAIPETILGPVVLSAIDLLRNHEVSRIKQCLGENCSWMFLDETKNKTRRWCDMAVCGNRSKARRHRRRQMSCSTPD